ncbi:MAG TPA: branched-chain amino acid transaminase [Actinospica sp.]|jgi:branched-chain amino acid aminotransferase|nr:branched-chain amino acid transaminase [Actinospica sp.]
MTVDSATSLAADSSITADSSLAADFEPAVRPSSKPDLWIFHEGEYTRASAAILGPSTQALHYGTGVFEGIRCYRSGPEAGVSHIVSAHEHYRRLLDSAKLLRLDVPYSADELVEITVELIRRNGLTNDSYIRPIAYKRALEPGTPPGVRLRGVSTGFSIIPMPMPQYSKTDGIRCGVASWRRIPDSCLPARAKICGAYANNALAVDEVEAAGFEDAVFLNTRGEVSEASTANIFLVRAGTVVTPGVGSDILEGLTRAAAIEILREEAGLGVVERAVARSELYTAEEIFLTGTGCEIVPVVEVDHRPVGTGLPGPVTRLVHGAYQDLVRARAPEYARRLTRIEFTTTKGSRS